MPRDPYAQSLRNAYAPLTRQFAGEAASADHALGVLPGPLSELTVRRDQPVRRVGGRLAGDPVVGDLAALPTTSPASIGARPSKTTSGRTSFSLRPVPDELDEPLGGDVRPERALDVPAVDDQRPGHRPKLTEPQYHVPARAITGSWGTGASRSRVGALLAAGLVGGLASLAVASAVRRARRPRRRSARSRRSPTALRWSSRRAAA